MDKYDKFLADVVAQTEKGSLKWDTVNPSKYREYIFQSPFAYSGFESKYTIGGKTYILVFVEKKMPSAENDYDIVMEKYRCEMVVIADGTLVITLTEEYVDYDQLLGLGKLLESNNSSAEDLFKNFE